MKALGTHPFWLRLTLVFLATWGSSRSMGAADLPAPWLAVDLGNPAAPGSASESGGVFTIRGAGVHSSDQFHFVHRTLAGDGGIIARLVKAYDDPAQQAFAGLMIRDSRLQASQAALVYRDNRNNVIMGWHLPPDAYTDGGGSLGWVPPVWLRLDRTGDFIRGAVSPDGQDWVFLSKVRLSLATDTSVGLWVNSKDNATSRTASFDSVQSWQGQDFLPAHGVRREVWFTGGLTSISEFTNRVDVSQPADFEDGLARFESTGWGGAYGERLSGYLLPPTTGDYHFYVCSGRSAQLFVSADESPANRRLILESAGVPNRVWGSRVSEPIHLESGHAYYLELLHVETERTRVADAGVTWRLVGEAAVFDGAPPLSGECLIPRLAATAPSIVQQPQSCESYAGLPVTFTVQAAGEPLSYVWRKEGRELADGPDLSGTRTASLRLGSVQLADAGGYSVRIRNPWGEIESQAAAFTVRLPYGEQPTVPARLEAVALDSGSTEVSWPGSWAEVDLETTDDLAAAGSWAPVAVSPTPSQGRYRTALPASDQQRFFRLRIHSTPAPSVGLPPDPVTTAPALPTSVVTTMNEAIEFLYTGPNPVQLGVTHGTLEPRRAAALRGRVITREGAPLPGVDVSVLEHSEFGYTRTRADGWFDLAVNGGGALTVRFQRTGYLSAQRQIAVPWQDYAQLDEVALVPQDAVVTAIDLSPGAPVQVARGSPVGDRDGARQATLLFPAGVHAVMNLPDGGTQPLGALHVRATEYTVGPNGPQAMPAELPPTIGYTYCVELGVDEANALGAMEVTFSEPIPFYVENFLGFPVGGLVPVGYYDRQRAVWVPSANGRVIKILGQGGGLAALDLTGDDVADDAVGLAALGITDAERAQLASLYAPGQSLWRVPVPHLSTWDCNWGWGPPLDAAFPGIPAWLYEDPQPNKDCPNQAQTCRQSVPVAGTPYTLNYASDRTPGNTAANTLEIPYSHTNVPPSTKRIDLVIEVNGRKFTNSFTATPNGRFSFLWDGKDAYGRQVQGCQRVTVRVGFVYDGKYQSPMELFAAFGHNFVGDEMTVNSRQECTFWQDLESSVGAWHSRGLGLGGWSLNHHHAYDPNSRTVYYGDGHKRQAISTGRTINVSAGGGSELGYDVPAKQANLLDPQGVAVAPNGELYIADTGHHRIVKVDSHGLVRFVAGAESRELRYGGDGWPATAAFLNGPTYLAFGPDGSLYLNDAGNARIRRIGPSGIITTVAGGGSPADGLGDGGPATGALLLAPMGIAVGRDERLFIADSGHDRIRVVSPGGFIETAAGGGESLAEGAPAVQSRLESPRGVAVAADGTLYLSEAALRGPGWYDLCRIDQVGRLFVVAGVEGGVPRNGAPARTASLGPDFAIGLDGCLYAAGNHFGGIMARVGADGLIHHVAGKLNLDWPWQGYGGDGGPAVGAELGALAAAAFGPDGKLYLTQSIKWNPSLIRQVSLPMPGVTGASIRIPSEDGAEVFEFDAAGRHLRTLDSLTATALDTFHYDAAGLLASVEDGDGNVTTVDRASDGAPLAIVGPFGQRTTLQTDANGNLSRVTDPAGHTHQFVSRADGLLESVTDPRTHQFNFAYDAEGRLVREETPGCCAGELARNAVGGTTTVTATSSEGRQTTYASEILLGGEVRQRNTFPDGTVNETLTGIDASRAVTLADGTVVAEQDGGDARFGMDAPVLQRQTLRTPGGLARSLALEQRVFLSDPVNPLSLVSLTNIAIVNGRTKTAHYDAATRTLTTTSPEGRQTVAFADAQGRLTRIEVPGLEAVRLAYDARGRLERSTQGARESGAGYAPVTGYRVTTTNALGEITRFEPDAAGVITNLIRSDGTRWGMAQDGNGNLLSLTEPNATNVHRLSYTQHNLLETYRSPLGAVDTFSYNNDREPVRRQFPSGQVLHWVYETNGHLARLDTPSGTNRFSYHATNGLLARAISGDGQQQEFLYDGSLLTRVSWSGPVTDAVSYAYDNDFRVAVMAYAGLQLTNHYDGDGLATNLGPVHLTHDPANGLLLRVADGAFAIAYLRNAYGEITNTVATQGSELYRVDRAYDGLGRISRRLETIAGLTVAWDYAYDAIGQLVEVKRDGATVEAYAYDAVGNRIGVTNLLTGETLTAADYRYDADHKLLQAGIRTFTHDADGRIRTLRLSGAVTTYHYNTDGSLAGVDLPDGRIITYLHDSRGRRIARAVQGVRTHAWLYGDGLMPLAEYDGAGNLRTTFIYGGRWTPVAFIRGDATYHIVTDHLGSPRLVVDANGAVVKRVDYDAFGNVVLDTAPAVGLPFGFAGGMSDPDHALIRFGARDYQPATGQWTAKDAILFAGGFHLLGYVGNDPINAVDRHGLEAPTACSKAQSPTFDFFWAPRTLVTALRNAWAEDQERRERAAQSKRDFEEWKQWVDYRAEAERVRFQPRPVVLGPMFPGSQHPYELPGENSPAQESGGSDG